MAAAGVAPRNSRAYAAEERRLRRSTAITLLAAQGLASLALAWDIQWHRTIGRDGFRIPPHLLLSVGVAAIGLPCLAIVLRDTWRYRRGAGVDDTNSVPVLGLFHAPMGMVFGGFGALTTLISSAFDNLWWHARFGPDFVLWTPFHTSGLLGMILAAFGIVLAWGNLTVPTRRGAAAQTGPAVNWGLLLALVTLLGHLVVLAEPAEWQFPTTDLGPVRIASAPVLLALLVAWPLVVASRVGGRCPGASLLVALLLVRDTLFELVVPWMLRGGAMIAGDTISAATQPHIHPETIARDLALLAVAAILDSLRARRVVRPLGLGALIAPPLWAVGTGMTMLTSALTAGTVLPNGVAPGAPASGAAILLALMPAVVAGAASARFGAAVAAVLRWNRR